MDLSREVAGAIVRFGSLVDDYTKADPLSYRLGVACLPARVQA
jgi:hypothetical protein